VKSKKRFIGCGVHQKSYEQTPQKGVVEEGELVYCTKCGTNNAEGATVCVNCGASLYGTSTESRYHWGRRQYADEYYCFHRRSGTLAILIMGIVIVFIGFILLLNEIFNINIPLWEIILILVGAWFIARAAIRMKRRR
jgi:hypothetical protein